MITINPELLMTWAAIFIRTLSMLFPMPIFGDDSVPLHVKIALSLSIAFSFTPFITELWMNQVPQSILPLALMVVQEIMLGAMIGFVSKFIFDSVMMGANLVGYQMGFGTANLLMPGTSEQINAFTALHRILAVLMFLSLNLHHTMIKGLLDSFHHIPPGRAIFHGKIGEFLIRVSSTIFTTSLQLASPVLIALMFTMAGLGLLAKTVPQMNVFTLSFPLSFIIGLVIWTASLSLLPGWLEQHFFEIMNDISNLLRSVGSLNNG
ncbi:MAG: flagellar biosynthetic protein FliR [Oligoflexales bacterium]